MQSTDGTLKSPINWFLLITFCSTDSIDNQIIRTFQILPNTSAISITNFFSSNIFFSLWLVTTDWDNKTYFIIYQQIARHFVHYIENLSNPPFLLCNSIFNSFLNSRISANYDRGFRFYPIVKSLYSLMFF